MGSVISLIVLGTSIWVYADAKSRGIRRQGKGFFDMGPIGWALSCLLLWIVAFPVYLAKRESLREQKGVKQITERQSKPSVLNRFAKWVVVLWSFVCAVGALIGLLNVSSSMRGLSNAEAAGTVIGLGIGLTTWFIAWAVVGVPGAIVYLLTRSSGGVAQPLAQGSAATQEPKHEPLPAPATQREVRFKKCPSCGKDVHDTAVKCWHCNGDLGAREDDATRRVRLRCPKCQEAFSVSIPSVPSSEMVVSCPKCRAKLKIRKSG